MQRTTTPSDTHPRFRRRAASVERGIPGPLLICVAGIHGNEYAGILAAERVQRDLEHVSDFRGRFVVLAGNLGALDERRRFIDRDLNRQWLPERVEALLSGNNHETPVREDEEQRELLSELRKEIDQEPGDAYFLDLHTSSAPGSPFATIGDTLRNRSFARKLGLPIILGLEEQIDGALLEYVNNLGYVTVGIEGGQHDAGPSVDNHESVLWLALGAAGNLPGRLLPDLERHRRRLREASRGVPPILEVRSRHVVHRTDRFVMKEGFVNFDPIEPGQLIASDRNGPIRARKSARLLLPLYQAQGNDGFFIVHEISPLWLGISRVLRSFRIPEIAIRMPGVRPHPERRETLIVNTRVARFFPLQLLHLLGFRKLRRHGDLLLVSRREHHLGPPGCDSGIAPTVRRGGSSPRSSTRRT